MTANFRTLVTGCKINLFLRVGALCANGYHDIETLFLPLDEPRDEICVSPIYGAAPGTLRCAFVFAGQNAGVKTPQSATTNHGEINPQSNTLIRACALFAEATGFAPALDIRVTKGIPVGAGLGGGSADAAAMLKYLQELTPANNATPLSDKALMALATRVGADVPFFILGRPAFAGGVGEKLTPCHQPFPGRYLLLVCPKVMVSTAWAFKSLAELRAKQRPKTRFTAQPEPGPDARTIQNSPFKKYAWRLTSEPPRASNAISTEQEFKNDFEELVFAHFPALAALHGLLVDSKAELVRISGTGASLFALYREKRIAQNAVKMLADNDVNVYLQRLPDR